MLRLSGQAAQELQEAQKLHAQLFCFYCIKFLNLISQMSCSSIVGMVAVLQTTLTGQFSVTVEARNKNPGDWRPHQEGQ